MNNNNNVRQITPEEIREAEGLPQPLTAEELQKTQILNLSELQKTIRFEKITSKKPALIIAIIGVALLAFGTTFQIVSVLSSNNNKVEKREIEKTPTKIETTLSCVKTTLKNPDGTDTTYKIDYYFENGKLESEIREYKYTKTENSPNGEETIKNNLNTYKQLQANTSGYQVNTASNNSTELTIITQIDYKALDLTVIPEKNNENSITRVDYNRNTKVEKIKEEMLNKGFTCD